MNLTEKIFSQLPGNPLEGLRKCEIALHNLRHPSEAIPPVMTERNEALQEIEYDVIIGGGTLGILIATALVLKGWRVALIERGILRGRTQEWNISRKELNTFLELNLLTESELERVMVTEYNPVRIRFPQSQDIWVRDILNIGVDPVYLLETLKNRFIQAGGILLENTPFKQIVIHPNGVSVNPSQPENSGENVIHQNSLTGRLFIDVMGHFSPLVKQVRNGQKPDGLCLVVGTCAQGFTENNTGDLFASFTPLENQCQYFWEAFPAKEGRTTYLFTYIDSHPDRFNLEFLFQEYWRLLPHYQNIELDQLKFLRALYGFFPCYRQSPLKSSGNRLIFMGDSSGSQSPLSFGGFGSMVRHLSRLTQGITEALITDSLDKNSLNLLQPYQPNISVTWLFQRAMSVEIQQNIPPDQINQLLTSVFQVMQQLGDPVLSPFLQDIVQFLPLSKTLFFTSIRHPLSVIKVIPQLGVINLIDWMIHYINLAIYSGLYPLTNFVDPWMQNLSPKTQYYYHRWRETWQYGSGQDYSP